MERISRLTWTLLSSCTAVATLAFACTGVAHDPLLKCHRCKKDCVEHRLVEKTIMVPMKVTETRIKNCIVETCEEREETYTCFVCKEDTRELKREICYLADEIKEQKITESKCKVVENPGTRLKNIKVPVTECVEQVVQREVCTECGPVCVEETVMCEKTRLVDDCVAEDFVEPQVVFEKSTRDIFYCIKTPKKHTVDCGEETFVVLEPVVKTRKVQVTVPKIEKQCYEVEVTRMVPKKVMCCVECSRHVR